MRRLTAFVLSGLTSFVAIMLVYRFIENVTGTTEDSQFSTGGKVACFLFLIAVMYSVNKLCQWAFKKKFWVAFVGCSGAIAVSTVVYIVPLLATPPPLPEQSIQEARAAYMRHDLAAFKSYVDVNAILSDGVDQATSSASDAVGGGILGTGVAIAASSWKQVYLPELSQQVEQFVVNGSVPNQSESDAFGIAMGSEFLRTLATSQLTYEGIAATQNISDSVALVTVRVRSPLSPRPLLVTLKLRAAGTHWQVVAIQNLAELLKQLTDSTVPDETVEGHKTQLAATEQPQPEPTIVVHYRTKEPAPVPKPRYVPPSQGDEPIRLSIFDGKPPVNLDRPSALPEAQQVAPSQSAEPKKQ